MKRRWCGYAALALMISFAVSAPPAQAAKRAVLVGVADFANARDLNGTLNDVDAMHALLVNRFDFRPGDIRVLKDEEASYAAIKRTISQDLVRETQPGDIVVVYVSSHGSRAPDAPGGDEADRWDETILSQDARTPGVYDITDDEFGRWLGRIAARTNNLTVILDTCHSGTGARATTSRYEEPDARLAPPQGAAAPATRDSVDTDLMRASNYVLISGSRAEEVSNEDYIDGSVRGALTHFFIKAVEGPGPISYRAAFPRAASRVTQIFPAQHPQIEGTGIDSYVFGDTRPAVERTILVEPVDRRHVKLHAGAAFGAAVGTRVAIHGPGDGPLDETPVLADAAISEVFPSHSIARLERATSLPAGSRARLDSVALVQAPRTVFLDPSLGDAAELAADLRTRPALALAGDREKADLVVQRARDGSVEILGRDRSLRSRFPDGASALEIRRKLVGWARWESLLNLENRAAPLNVDFDVRLQADPRLPLPPSVVSGARLTFTITNRTAAAVHVNVLDLTSEGAIELMFPQDAGAELRIPARQAHSLSAQVYVPEHLDAVEDTFLMIATSAPVDASVFVQGQLRDEAPRSVFDDVFTAWQAGRNARVGPADAWVTHSSTVRVSHSGVDADLVRFAVHVDDTQSAETLRTRLDQSRGDLCVPGAAADCIGVEPVSSEAGVFEVRASGMRGERTIGETRERSIGALFDEAYRIRQRTGAEYVEPLLTVRMQEFDTGRGGDDEEFEIARDNPRWSLEYANVPAAWQKLQAMGKQPGREGEGIVFAHVDTGYTTHPEMSDDAHPPVLRSRGHNYMDGSGNAEDPRTADGVLKHPGHGTAAGSVIVSPEGCQLANQDKCPTGSGRGAQLVPLRLNDSVVLFSTSKLAKVFFDIAAGKHGTDISAVSLAMGGPPSLSLHKATKALEARNILLFAAAGNYVQTVVWPARFDAAIAVSAINPLCDPWPHASHGDAVDISAPGQGVWRATFIEDEPGSGMGAGTTFATGTLAGVGALWLNAHRDDPAVASLRAHGELTRGFRTLLQRTAWLPDADARPPGVACDRDWDASEYGAGIVDAAALLAAPVPARAPRGRGAGDDAALPLFSTLYPPTADERQPADDYARLFVPAAQDTRQFETEILHHYTMNAEVRAAIDRIVAGERALTDFDDAREALLDQDLSSALRQAMEGDRT